MNYADTLPHRGIHAAQQSLTEEELDKLLLAARLEDLRDFVIIDLMYELFLRVSEVLALRCGDVMPDGRVVCRRLKGSKDNILPIRNLDALALVKAACEKRKDRAALLFDNVSRRTLDWRIKKYGHMAGLPPEKCHAHALKHTACQLTMDETDGNIMAVKTLAGHSDIGSTLSYADITTEDALKIRERYESMKKPNSYTAVVGGRNER
ncbi:MAG: tyrosine-type recombinase/integrase [Candidatus Sulfotelmatobacter sp.]